MNMKDKLHAQYVIGFVDGEGSFHVAIYKDPRMKTGIKIIPEFHVSQNSASKAVLEQLCEHFGCGYVKENHAKNQRDKTSVLVVRNREDLSTKIIPFFEKHSLRTEKRNDFQKFAEIVYLMRDGAHRTQAGIKSILDLAYSMNQGGKFRRKKHILTENPQRLHAEL